LLWKGSRLSIAGENPAQYFLNCAFLCSRDDDPEDQI
jgi:hypothetical protein